MKKRLVLYITEKCNRNCQKCYIKQHSNKTMDKKITDKIINYYLHHVDEYSEIVFIGGETMLAIEIVKYIYNKISKINPNIIYDFMTNGTISIRKLAALVDVSNFAFNISFDSLNDIDNAIKIENLQYALKNGYQANCLLVNTPDKIEENFHLAKMLSQYKPSSIKILRQHKTGDFWTNNDIKRYESILPQLMHLSLYHELKGDTHIILPDKITIPYRDIPFPKNKMFPSTVPQSPVCQDSIEYCVIVGVNGERYLCDGAYGEDNYKLGYIWDEPVNVYKKSFGYYGDYMYNYCYLANKKILPKLDKLNNRYRNKCDKIRNKIELLR